MPEIQISGSIQVTIPFQCECGAEYENRLGVGKTFECECGQEYSIDINGHVWKAEVEKTPNEVETDEESDSADYL